jgi:hypothetical protein
MEQQTREKSRSWIGVIIFALGIGIVTGVYTTDYRVGLIFGFFGGLLVATGLYVITSGGKKER